MRIIFCVVTQIHCSLSCQKEFLNEKGDGTKVMEKYEQLEAKFCDIDFQ